MAGVLAEAFTEGRCALAGIKQSLKCVRKPCGGVAKAAFDTGWNQSRIDAFTFHPESSDHSLVPARCPKLKGDTAVQCPCTDGAASWRDFAVDWPGPDLPQVEEANRLMGKGKLP